MDAPNRNPSCPIHGDLALGLVRGALSTRAARQAEEAVASCRVCKDWVDGLAVASVSQGVADAVASFRVPRQRPAERRWGLQVAAAAVLLLAGAAVWRAGERATPPEPPRPAAAVTISPPSERAPEPAADGAGKILVANGFESRTFEGWKVSPPS